MAQLTLVVGNTVDLQDSSQTIILNQAGTLTYGSGGSGTGDVIGPSSATDNALARFNGTGGKIIQSSPVIAQDDGRLSNITDPTGNQDAATKSYVDTQVASGSVSDGDKGDVTVSGSGSTWTVDSGVITNTKLANVNTNTIKGRATAGAGSPEDLTASQVRTLLNVEDGAEVNNISDTDAADLTDGGNTTLHTHDSRYYTQSQVDTSLGTKQNTITGAATTITGSDLTANRAVISNASGKVGVSTVTDTELGYLSGVTSSVQMQINNKQATLISGTNIKTINGTSLLGSGDITISSGGAVDSVNGQTGVVVLDADDIDDTATTNKFVTAGDITKLSNLSGTNTGDVTVLDTSEIDLTLTGQQISASIVAGSIDESKLDTSVNASLDLADSALQNSDIGVSVQAHSSILDNTTASFTTADETKLDYISVTQAVDLDQMETDIAALSNGMVYKGNWDASAGTFPGAGAAQTGWFYYVSVGGTVDSVSFSEGDNIVATTDNASTTIYSGNWSKHDQTDAVQSVAGKVGAVTLTSSDVGLGNVVNVDTSTTTNITDSSNKRFVTDAEKTKLSNTSGTNTGDQTSIVGITGTTSQFNTALTDGDFATLAGTETLTNKTLSGASNTITNIAQSSVTNLVSDLAAKASTSTTISAGTGLTGGGDLSSNRTISLNITGLTSETSVASGDELAIYDTSAGAQRKMTVANLLSAPTAKVKLSANQNVTNTQTVQFVDSGTGSYDTNNWYDNSTYRYTPQRAGYYGVYCSLYFQAGTSTTCQVFLQSNTAASGAVLEAVDFNTTAAVNIVRAYTKVYLNGTTDYLFISGVGSGGVTRTLDALYCFAIYQFEHY